MKRRMTTKERIIQTITPAVLPLVRLYWFIWRPHTYGVKVVLINEERILLVRHAYGSGGWTFPGGRVEGDENYREAAVREVKEELGVEVHNVKKCGDFTSREEYKYDHITVFSAESIQDISPSPFEIAEAQWFALDNFPQITQVAERVLKKYEND